MPMDLNRIIEAAAEAALQGQGPNHQATDKAKSKRKGLTTPRAFLIGAGVFTVGRLLAASRGRDVLGDLQERLAIYESEHFGSGASEDGDEEPAEDEEFDDEPEDEYDEDEEPEGEYDEDEAPEDDEEPEDDDEEPEGEYDEDEEPQGEYDEDEEPEDEEPEDEDRPRRRRTSSAGSRNGRH
jgi:hypothetical protein